MRTGPYLTSKQQVDKKKQGAKISRGIFTQPQNTGTWADPELTDKFRFKTPEHKDELATQNY